MRGKGRKTFGWLVIGLVLLTTFLIGAAHYMFYYEVTSFAYWNGKAPGVMRKETFFEEQEQLSERLAKHVFTLAEEIGERNVFKPVALHQAEEYITSVWRHQGYEVKRYEYQVEGQLWANLEVTRQGSRSPKEIILVGAHYDSVYGSPGANDNASGVAAMLEISRYFALKSPERTVRFVAFANEEPPFFKTPQMGSRVYAKQAHERGEEIRAMLSLETIGYYSEEKGSQKYPPLFGFFYPDQGNFLGFVSNLPSRSLVKEAKQAFQAHSSFPLECLSIFSIIPGVDWSDHSSFWQYGYQALMVTDTAPYRYPYYHTMRDTPEKINYDLLARVTEGLLAVVINLATAREEKERLR